MERSANGEEPKSWEDLYNINLLPSEIFLKFRKEMQGIRVGVNLEVFFVEFFILLRRCKFLEFFVLQSIWIELAYGYDCIEFLWINFLGG